MGFGEQENTQYRGTTKLNLQLGVRERSEIIEGTQELVPSLGDLQGLNNTIEVEIRDFDRLFHWIRICLIFLQISKSVDKLKACERIISVD